MFHYSWIVTGRCAGSKSRCRFNFLRNCQTCKPIVPFYNFCRSVWEFQLLLTNFLCLTLVGFLNLLLNLPVQFLVKSSFSKKPPQVTSGHPRCLIESSSLHHPPRDVWSSWHFVSKNPVRLLNQNSPYSLCFFVVIFHPLTMHTLPPPSSAINFLLFMLYLTLTEKSHCSRPYTYPLCLTIFTMLLNFFFFNIPHFYQHIES